MTEALELVRRVNSLMSEIHSASNGSSAVSRRSMPPAQLDTIPAKCRAGRGKRGVRHAVAERAKVCGRHGADIPH